MPEWLTEHIAEIALLIYIFFPLLKRWSDRRKQRREARKATKAPKATSKARARTRPAPSPRSAEAARHAPPVPRPAKAPAPAPAKHLTEKDFVAAARSKLERVREEAARLLGRVQADPRLTRLEPALREDLLGRLDAIQRVLESKPTLSAVVQETSALRALEELLRYLRTMAQQRTVGPSSFIGEADAIADSLYEPLIELARAQVLPLRTSRPVVVIGDWSLSLVPRFAATRVAPLRLPKGFEHSLWRWPGIAHEVAHDFYYSLEGLEDALHARLRLPKEVELPRASAEVDGAWLRGLFGAWLSELFADSLGTVALGPAYVETMRRTFRNPGSPQRTAAIFQDGGRIDDHPPARLRLYVATRVLRHLGRHEEADALWEQWKSEHADAALYYLPLGGQWVGLSEEVLHPIADSVVDTLVQDPWPELQGLELLSIPGLAYLHAEHSEVQRLATALALGNTVNASARWVVAAAVLAAAAQPTLHDQILEAAQRSIIGAGEPAVAAEPLLIRSLPKGTIGEEVVSSLRQPAAIRDAIVLGTAFTAYRRPSWGARWLRR